MKKIILVYLLIVLLALPSIPTASAALTRLNYPRDNDIITYTNNVEINITSAGSSNCVLYYQTSLGIVPYNQSVVCNGISSVDLPNANGLYNISIADDAGDIITHNIEIKKPVGILITSIYIITFLIFLGLFFMTFLLMAKLAILNVTIYNILTSLALFFGVLIMYQFNQEFTTLPFIIDWLDITISLGWIFVIWPIAAFFISFFVNAIKKRDVPTAREITGKEMYQYG